VPRYCRGLRPSGVSCEVERWKDVPGWEGFYQASSHGRIRSVDRLVRQESRWGTQCRLMKGKILAQHFSGGIVKYLSVALSRPGVRPKSFLVHRLVAFAFLGRPEPGCEVCHWDGMPTNNCVDNLRWDSRSANHRDKERHGTSPSGERNPQARLSLETVLRIKSSRGTVAEIARELGLPYHTVYGIVRGLSWRSAEQSGV
jgi:hypothetical protein